MSETWMKLPEGVEGWSGSYRFAGKLVVFSAFDTTAGLVVAVDGDIARVVTRGEELPDGSQVIVDTDRRCPDRPGGAVVKFSHRRASSLHQLVGGEAAAALECEDNQVTMQVRDDGTGGFPQAFDHVDNLPVHGDD